MSRAAVYRLIFSTILLTMGAGYITMLANYFQPIPMATVSRDDIIFMLFLCSPGFILMILAVITRAIRG